MRILFMGTPEFAVASLRRLVEDGKVILSASGTDKDFSQKEKKPKHVAG